VVDGELVEQAPQVGFHRVEAQGELVERSAGFDPTKPSLTARHATPTSTAAE
jgi:hypothetical protein